MAYFGINGKKVNRTGITESYDDERLRELIQSNNNAIKKLKASDDKNEYLIEKLEDTNRYLRELQDFRKEKAEG